MGKKSRRDKKAKREEKFFASQASVEGDCVMKNQDVKSRSKLSKKLRRKLMKQEQCEKQEGKLSNEAKERCGFHMVSVYVKDNVKIDKTFLLSSIGNYVDIPFCPLGFFRGSDSITFYFDSNTDIAQAIRALNKRIPSPSGELMGIKVSYVEETDFILNCDQVELLKTVILRRFTPATGLLDLSSLHLDSQFLESNTFVTLSNERILKQVLTILKENMPNVNALDLSNNKLGSSSLKLFESLDMRCSSLCALNLEKNNIKHVHCLKYLRFFPLKELKVAENHFNKNTRSSSPQYIKSIRKELPFLKVLDGQDLSSTKVEPKLDLSNPASNQHPSPLAARLMGEMPTAVDEDKMKTFLEQYYALLDSTEKSSLQQAYVPTAKIGLKSKNPYVPSSAFEGQTQIVEFLSSWPATKHDYTSFNLEILSLSPAEGVAQVSGVCLFQEPEISLQFKRTMKIVPFNSGFCCAEDLLEIL